MLKANSVLTQKRGLVIKSHPPTPLETATVFVFAPLSCKVSVELGIFRRDQWRVTPLSPQNIRWWYCGCSFCLLLPGWIANQLLGHETIALFTPGIKITSVSESYPDEKWSDLACVFTNQIFKRSHHPHWGPDAACDGSPWKLCWSCGCSSAGGCSEGCQMCRSISKGKR